MKKGIIYPVSRIRVQPTMSGISLEEQIRKMMNDKEPIQATAKIDYSERKDGVLPQYDIRHDKFNSAIEATEKMYGEAFTARTLTDKGFVQDKDGHWGHYEGETFIPMGEA